MISGFRLARKKITARWLTEGEGELVGYSIDLMVDTFVQRVYLGLLARFPETAPVDALPPMGRDRRVIRGINEAVTSYVGRLLRWADDRKTAGNPFALLTKLAETTGPGVRFRTVDNRGNWYTRNVDGTWEVHIEGAAWDWDSLTAEPARHFGDPSGPIIDRWSRFWVIIYPPATLWTEGVGWNDPDRGAWAESTSETWGSTAPREHVETIRAIVADWKPAGTRCVNIIVAFDAASFDPTAPSSFPAGDWGRWSKNVAGVQVPARLATARYWDGV